MNAISDSRDNTQYSEAAIGLYEAIFGTNFVSPGGETYALELCLSLNITSEQHILDAGCGLGGAAFLMAEKFGCSVDAIDISNNMLRIASDRLAQRDIGSRVALRQSNCATMKANDVYDAVYSRDVFLHIHNKPELFSSLYRALKTGGTLLFTDYGCCSDRWSDAFQQYVWQRDYTLHTLDEYQEFVEQAGFNIEQAVDQTKLFIQFLETEYTAISTTNLKREEKLYLRDSWRQKIERAKSGEHKWYLFRAIKL